MADVVIGGHEVRRRSFVDVAETQCGAGVLPRAVVTGTRERLTAWARNVRPGFATTPSSDGGTEAIRTNTLRSPRDVVRVLADDIRDFATRHDLERVVVVNLASTEPPLGQAGAFALEHSFSAALDGDGHRLPDSCLYALAAVETRCAYINFTPSCGISPSVLQARAVQAGLPYAGSDGKTGETLVKSVLAPMFARRALRVLSWTGHNILGNDDGRVLQNPDCKRSKVQSKSHVLGRILGYEPESIVNIDYVASLGEWKTAWDHVHFAGFLGAPMTLQFTWQGLDSILAAPLVIDLVRWADLAMRRGESGCLRHLASYFKSPLDVGEADFFRQWAMLERYATACASSDVTSQGTYNGRRDRAETPARIPK
ncbi:MAG: inositol-3-phosphate synthase [Phycisphaerales bacterium]|nr:inositol-3-phosphate synthase [Phycisphaerales bacterium]